MLLDKIKLPILLVGSLLGAAAGAGGMVASQKARTEETAKRVDAAEERLKEVDTRENVHQRTEGMILQKLEDIAADVKDLKSRK